MQNTWIATAPAWRLTLMGLLFIPTDVWAIILIAGMSVLVVGFLPIRGSDERRCPNCWYSLAHVMGSRCPECAAIGHSIDDMYPIRYRWPVIAAGAAIMSPAIWAFEQDIFESNSGAHSLRSLSWAVIVLGIVIGLGGLRLLVHVFQRLMLFRRLGRLPPVGWLGMLFTGLLIVIHGFIIINLPLARVGGWTSVLPAWVFDLARAIVKIVTRQ